jgi:hypothetical protein
VWENPNVDPLGCSNKAQHRVTEDTITPSIAETVANENLSDALLCRKINDRRDRFVAFQNFSRRARFFSRF